MNTQSVRPLRVISLLAICGSCANGSRLDALAKGEEHGSPSAPPAVPGAGDEGPDNSGDADPTVSDLPEPGAPPAPEAPLEPGALPEAEGLPQAPAPQAPAVDPAESAEYRWEECGRTPVLPQKEAADAVYAADSSVFVLNSRGGLDLFPPDAVQPISLTPGKAELVQAEYTRLQVSQDGRHVLIIAGDRATDSETPPLEVWATRDGLPLGAQTRGLEQQATIQATRCDQLAKFSSDALHVVSWGSRVCVWDAVSGELRSEFESPADALDSFDVTESTIVVPQWGSTASGDAELDFVLLTLGFDGQEIQRQVSPQNAPFVDAQFSPDGSRIALSSANGLVMLDRATLKPIWTHPRTRWVSDYSFVDGGKSLAFSGKVSQTSSKIGVVSETVWLSAEDGTPVESLPVGSSRFHLPGRALTVVQGGGLVEVDAAWPKERVLAVPPRTAFALAVSQDGRFFAHMGFDSAAVVWQVEEDFSSSRPSYLVPPEDLYTELALSPDGQLAIVGGYGAHQLVRSNGEQYVSNPHEGDSCHGGQWTVSSNGRWAFGSAAQDNFLLSDLSTGEMLEVPIPPSCAGSAFSPDGSRVVTADITSLKMYDTADWSELWSVPRPAPGNEFENLRSGVAYSPDGTEFAVTSCDSYCGTRRHRTSDGAQLGSGLVGQQYGANYSPEGHWLLRGFYKLGGMPQQDQLLHLPSETSVRLPGEETFAARFTSEGDIIAASADSFVKYCRKP